MYQGKKVGVLILAAGSGSRMGPGPAKQYREVGGKPVLERTLAIFASHPAVDDILLITKAEDRSVCEAMGISKGNGKVRAVIPGGDTRQKSVWNGLRALEALREAEEENPSVKGDLVLIQDGARPFTSRRLVDDVMEAAHSFGAAIPCIPVADTIKRCENSYVKKTVPREQLFGAQTPQGFRREILTDALRKARKKGWYVTDDASVVERAHGTVRVVEGDVRNIKITTIEDMATAEMLAAVQDQGLRPTARYMLTGSVLPQGMKFSLQEQKGEPERRAPEPAAELPLSERNFAAVPQAIRIGEGYDVHMLVPDRALVLGGVTVPYERGLLGHSDADVLTHAVMDALLGAAALGDIGRLFPDSDPAYEGAYSLALLEVVRRLLEKRGLRVGNLDVTVEAQEPKLAPYIPVMRKNLARILQISEGAVNVKATTTERLGFVGRGEGIAASAVCMLLQGELPVQETTSKPAPVTIAPAEKPVSTEPSASVEEIKPKEEAAEIKIVSKKNDSPWIHLTFEAAR